MEIFIKNIGNIYFQRINLFERPDIDFYRLLEGLIEFFGWLVHKDLLYTLF